MRGLFGLLYIVRFVICAMAAGVFLTKIHVFKQYSEKNVFGIGFCSSPFYTALIEYICCLLFPGISRYVLVIGLPFCALVYLLIQKNRKVLLGFFSDMKSNAASMWNSKNDKYLSISCLMFALFFTGMIAVQKFLTKVLEERFLNKGRVVYAKKVYKGLLDDMPWISVVVAVIIFLSLCFLIIVLKKALKKIKSILDKYIDANNIGIKSWKKYFILLTTGFFAGIFVMYCMRAVGGDLYEHDRSHYELQARYFAETRISMQIDNYQDEKYGTVMKDDHGPLWPVFIADARMVSMGKEDYFNPVTIDCAYIMITVCCLGMIAITTVILTESKLAGLLAIFIMCMYRYALHFHFLGSRDSLRIIGILLLGLYVLDICMRLFKRRDAREHCLKIGEGAVILLFCYFCMQGHGGNAYIMLGLFVAFGIIALMKKMRVQELIGMALCVLAGTILGAMKTIIIYMETGSLDTSITSVFAGTKVAERLDKLLNERWKWGKTAWDSIIDTYQFSDVLIIILGIAGIIYFLYHFYKKCKKKEDIQIIEIWVLLVIGMLLPLSGIMDIFGFECALSFIIQLRYRLYFLILFSIVGACWIYTMQKDKRDFLTCIGICIVGFLSIGASYIEGLSYLTVDNLNSITDSYRYFASEIEEYSESGNIYVTDEVFAYYFYKNPKLIYTPFARELIIAQTNEEIENAINDLNIKVVTFDPPWERQYDFQFLPFYNYLQNGENAEQIILKAENGSELLIYVIK